MGPTVQRWSRASLALAVGSVLAMAAVADRAGSEPGPGSVGPRWRRHLDEVDTALALRKVTAALAAWREAYGEAAGARRWEAMIEVGDAYLRIGEVGQFRASAQGRAREAYLSAIFHARRSRSVDGMLRAAEAFRLLGDREVAQRCANAADGLALQLRDLEARTRVRELTERLHQPTEDALVEGPAAS